VKGKATPARRSVVARFKLDARAAGALLLAGAITAGPALSSSPREIHRDPQTGAIAGRVVSSKDGSPLAFCNIMILDTSMGTFAMKDGRYRIAGVPAGRYSVLASMIGYAPHTAEGIVVRPGATTVVDFSLTERIVKEMDEVIVREQYTPFDPFFSGTRHVISEEELLELPVKSVQEVIALRSGVTVKAGELHVRGGRTNDLIYLLDGMTIADPLTLQSPHFGAAGIRKAELFTGGLNAEHGGTLGGLAEIETRSFRRKFSGEINWASDETFLNRLSDLGRAIPLGSERIASGVSLPSKYSRKQDRLWGYLAGPLGTDRLGFSVSYDGLFENTHLPRVGPFPGRRFFKLFKLGGRRNGRESWQGKLSYRPSGGGGIELEAIESRSLDIPYFHQWSKSGLVGIWFDPRSPGFICHSDWVPSPDSSETGIAVPYDAPSHSLRQTNRFRLRRLAAKRALSESVLGFVQAAYYTFDSEENVQDKKPWEYEGGDTFPFGNGNLGCQTGGGFFANNGDFPYWGKRKSETWALSGYLFGRFKTSHVFKTGFQIGWHRYDVLELDDPSMRVSLDLDPTRQKQTYLGGRREVFQHEDADGSFYLQDRWTYEGMVMNAGVRFDFFRIDDNVSDRFVSSRLKRAYSPRLGVSLPISERTLFHFHFGRFVKFPPRIAVYAGLDRRFHRYPIGNRDLDFERCDSFEAGIHHSLTNTLTLKTAAFYREFSGLLRQRWEAMSADELEGMKAGADTLPRFLNTDYASATGFEVALILRQRKRIRAEISYTFSRVSGLIVQPEWGYNQSGASALAWWFSEAPADWDQYHNFTFWCNVSGLPHKASLGITATYASGFPYTALGKRQTGGEPSKEVSYQERNTGRLPGGGNVGILYEQPLPYTSEHASLFLQIRNLLDSRRIANLAPPNTTGGQGGPLDYARYYEETGDPEGAYEYREEDTGASLLVPVHDPRVRVAPRSVLIGIRMKL